VLDPALLRPGRSTAAWCGPPGTLGGARPSCASTPRRFRWATCRSFRAGARHAGPWRADLANLVNEAALNAARQNRKVVMMIDFELAKDKILMGAERKSLILSDAEKRNRPITSRHALVAAVIPEADPLHKVTIIPRGMALASPLQLPIDDKHSYSKDTCCTACHPDGRAHRRRNYMHHMTRRATISSAPPICAQRWCASWGVSELGPLSFGKRKSRSSRPRDRPAPRLQRRPAIRIDAQVKKLVQGAYDTAEAIIKERSEALVNIAETLLVREILTATR